MPQRNSIDLESGVDESGEFQEASACTNPSHDSFNARSEEIEIQNTGTKIIV